jgi:hypothetical protein
MLADMSIDWTSRFHALGELLAARAELWRPAPFHEPRPAWCRAYPDLTARLLALGDGEVAALAGDNGGLIGLVARFVPGLEELPGLIALPRADVRLPPASGHECWYVPGRKQAQIEAFAGAVGAVRMPVLEWCAGKGHLGRMLARHCQVPVTSLERDGTLCQAGQALAAKAGVAQDFVRGDALDGATARHLVGHHTVALHACGDLHLALLRGVVSRRAPALDLAPCCFYRTAQERYQPLCADAVLALSRDDLHLAVTDTVTGGCRERRRSDTARAWKLAFLELRAASGVPRERPFRPVPEAWLGLGFANWMRRLCGREAVPLPDGVGWMQLEQVGWQRHAEVCRLELVRLAFRRPLEIWLALDRVLYLERHGYRVRLTEFCERGLTPRNLMISARL